MHPEILYLSGVRHVFPDPATRGKREVLNVPELRVHRGEFLAVLGPSGGGKSTLINLIAGFFPPSGGNIFKNRQIVRGPGPDRVVVFQDHAVFPWYTALENAAYGLRGQKYSRKKAKEKALEALRLVGLADFAQAYPATLSGGMRQRVALARALALQPDILLLDEPFASLDAATRTRLQDELLHLRDLWRPTIIMVTHSPAEAVYLADRVALLHPPPHGLDRIFSVPVPRPRNRHDPALKTLTEQVMQHLHAEHSGQDNLKPAGEIPCSSDISDF